MLLSRVRVFLLLHVIWFAFLVIFLRCCQKHPTPRPHGKAKKQDDDATWLSARSASFAARWKHHKWRNIAVYACLSTRKLPTVRSITRFVLACPSVFYEQRYDRLFRVPNVCVSHACLRPFGKAHYVYAEFVLKTFDAITAQTISPVEPTTDGKIAVLVEPRAHPLLEYAIKQVMTTLGRGWALQLFLSSANEKYVRDRLRIHAGGMGENIVVTPLSRFGLDDMGEYGGVVQSAFSAHEAMYAEIRSEHILWFQVDVIMRSNIKSEWLQYAYVGAEWPGCEYPTCSPVTCTNICGGGNSGLSLRRKSKLQLVATRGTLPESLWGREVGGDDANITFQSMDTRGYFASDRLHDNSKTQWFEDDVQISYKLSKLHLLPPGGIQSRFAIDQALAKSVRYSAHGATPAGMHKSWLTPRIAPDIIVELLQMPYDRALSF